MLFLPLFFLSENILAQKRSRLDQSISRSRYLGNQLQELKAELETANEKVSERAGVINYYSNEIKPKDDSVRTQKSRFERSWLRLNYQLAA